MGVPNSRAPPPPAVSPDVPGPSAEAWLAQRAHADSTRLRFLPPCGENQAGLWRGVDSLQTAKTRMMFCVGRHDVLLDLQ